MSCRKRPGGRPTRASVASVAAASLFFWLWPESPTGGPATPHRAAG